MRLQNVMGSTHISTIVLSKLVGMAAKMTGGIASMPTSWLEGISNKLSGGSLQNGIELKVDQSSLEINIKSSLNTE
ncbi:Asp23/Gls24 family envelope stress response protein [Paenibacillus sp. CAU 1782]